MRAGHLLVHTAEGQAIAVDYRKRPQCSGSAPWSSALQMGSRTCAGLGYDRTSKLWIAYAAMGILLLAYLGWLISGNHSTLIDGWGVSAFELVGGALCIASGLVRREARWVPIILGAALMAWAFGHLTETIETLGGATPPEAALYDAFQLSFYPLGTLPWCSICEGRSGGWRPRTGWTGSSPDWARRRWCAATDIPCGREFDRQIPPSDRRQSRRPVGDLLLLLLVVGGVPSSRGETGGRGWWLRAQLH